MRGQSLSVESVLEAMEIAMGSRLIMGGELLIESEAERVVVRSLFTILESSAGRELFRVD